mmetsp:Transcript_28278/g.83044  ORF Transcript_28278/g.83044 Transcript_28278/m.83044 type:complete len:202 (+) Transcript_28278:298-903(+)
MPLARETRGLALLLGARDVAVLPRVHLDVLSLLDEERHLNHRSRLEGGGLGAALHGVTLDTRVRLLHPQSHLVRQVHGDDAPLPLGHLRIAVLFQIVDLVDLVLDQAHLLKGGHVHEDVLLAVLVGELHVELLHLCRHHILPRLPRLLDCVARDEVLELAAHKSCALAGLHVEKFLHLIHATLGLDSQADLEVVGREHHGQ